MAEAEPVDDARLVRLHVAAQIILERAERHTPLERQWAKEVVDLAVALRAARDELDRLRGSAGRE
jgi:hypothetical protein